MANILIVDDEQSYRQLLSMVFEGGGRIFMDVTDVEPGDIDSGTPVRMVFRVKEWDDRRGFTRYFWKAAPDRRKIAAGASAKVAAE